MCVSVCVSVCVSECFSVSLIVSGLTPYMEMKGSFNLVPDCFWAPEIFEGVCRPFGAIHDVIST